MSEFDLAPNGLRAQDVPALRADAAMNLRILRDPANQKDTRHVTADQWPVIVEGIESKLPAADLFYVAAEMVELGRVAARTLPELSFDMDDLPAPSGLLVLGQPIVPWETPRVLERAEAVVAIQWNGYRNGVACSVYADRDRKLNEFPEGGMAASHGWPDDAYHRDLWRRTYSPGGGMPRLLWADFGGYEYGPSGVHVNYHDGRRLAFQHSDLFGTAHWFTFLVTVWRLMRQTEIVETTQARPTRQIVRQAARHGEEVPAVRVIHLRRRSEVRRGGKHHGRDYKHQWITRGHWRLQPYRDGIKRSIWIAAHVKGPAGKPLLGGDKVYSLDR